MKKKVISNDSHQCHWEHVAQIKFSISFPIEQCDPRLWRLPDGRFLLQPAGKNLKWTVKSVITSPHWKGLLTDHTVIFTVCLRFFFKFERAYPRLWQRTCKPYYIVKKVGFVTVEEATTSEYFVDLPKKTFSDFLRDTTQAYRTA